MLPNRLLLILFGLLHLQIQPLLLTRSEAGGQLAAGGTARLYCLLDALTAAAQRRGALNMDHASTTTTTTATLDLADEEFLTDTVSDEALEAAAAGHGALAHG